MCIRDRDREDVNYVLSKDISKKKVPDNLIGRVTFVKAGEKLTLYTCLLYTSRCV